MKGYTAAIYHEHPEFTQPTKDITAKELQALRDKKETKQAQLIVGAIIAALTIVALITENWPEIESFLGL